MKPEGIASFSHLLDALRAGCPPHAGFAIGFDRLIVMMLGRNSVRDVIAFPKDKRGHDLTIKSPGSLTTQHMRDYGFVRPSYWSIKPNKLVKDEKSTTRSSTRKLNSVISVRVNEN